MVDDDFRVNSHRIRAYIDTLVRHDDDSTMTDLRVKAYYRNRKPFLWITRHGIDCRADSLVASLDSVGLTGFSPRQFYMPQLRNDLEDLRRLRVGREQNINELFARLEYHLSKAFFRYVTGQRFGYFNPRFTLNRLDVLKEDSDGVKYRRLFDMKMQLPGPRFFSEALSMLAHDSVGVLLRTSQPTNPYYYRLQAMLRQARTQDARNRILCNMERARWRLADSPDRHAKCVVVNIPSYHLYAINGDEWLTMRIGCGSLETKTPLLSSQIKRIDLNPRWIIPRSILEKSILRHAGDPAYFHRHRYGVAQRSTGKRVSPHDIRPWMLNSTDYYVYQEGGEGNALGRIIFRFDNNFAVYLHYTSAPEVFSREDRGVSHGCIRVEKPYELALFLLPKPDEEVAQKIRYSITADLAPLEPDFVASEEQPDTLNRKWIINSVKIEPRVPLFITYYTLFPGPDHRFEECADVYGYDGVILRHLKNYM